MVISQQHGQAVDAHTKAAVGRHAIGHGLEIILIHRVALFILIGIIAPHLYKTRFLVQRIVQLGEGVAQFHAAHKPLEAFHGLRIARFTLRQRRNIARVIVQEGRLDKVGLQKVADQAVNQLTAGSPRFNLQALAAHRVGQAIIGAALRCVNIHTHGIDNALAQFNPAPGGRQIHLVAVKGDLARSQHLVAHISDHLFGQRHDLLVIGVGHIKLELRELGVVFERNPFIAEVAPDLIYPIEHAHQQPFEIELKRNAQV